MLFTCSECSTTITERDIQYGTIARCPKCNAIVDCASTKLGFPSHIKVVEKANTEGQKNYRAEVSKVEPFELTYETSNSPVTFSTMLLAVFTGTAGYFWITSRDTLQVVLGWLCATPFALVMLIIAIASVLSPVQKIELTPSELMIGKGTFVRTARRIPVSEIRKVATEKSLITTLKGGTKIYGQQLCLLLADGSKVVILPAREGDNSERDVQIIQRYLEQKLALSSPVRNEQVVIDQVRVELDSAGLKAKDLLAEQTQDTSSLKKHSQN